MLQRVLALLLQRLLGKFVSFDSSMLRLSLWQGDLEFKDLELRLSYGEGSIGELSVKIPWRALWTQPVVIRASHIRILLHQSPKESSSNGLTSSVSGSEDDASDAELEGSTDRTYLSRLVSHIIANVQIELTDVQVRYDCATDSIAKRPGSASLEVKSVRLINANAEWELTYTPQSNSIMESRKLLTTEGISAYVEYDEEDASAPGVVTPRRCRRYVLHDWHTTAKATLSYPSASASFPDVELDISVGCRKPADNSTDCSYCGAERSSDLVSTALRNAHKQPTIHFGAEHIDVFYSILMEVRAPYEEFERFAELTQKQSSRPEGFLMVLSYARQWLLSDCLDGIATESTTIVGDDSDDDDDEFEDAITPPSLTIRTILSEGIVAVAISRNFESTDSRIWMWSLGFLSASMKQSCVEDEIQLRLGACSFLEVADIGAKSYCIVGHGGDADDARSTVVHFSCIIPAYQSRLVGHQPAMVVRVSQDFTIKVKDETLTRLMTLFSPVYHWWNQWNRRHPAKQLLVNDMRIAPISRMTVEIRRVSIVFEVHNQLSLGVSTGGIQAITTEMDEETVATQFHVRELTVFSSSSVGMMTNTPLSSSTVHSIVSFETITTTKSSHSRIGWNNELYVCQHQSRSSRDRETAMYRYSVQHPQIDVDLKLAEIEGIAWALGKWSFFMPASSSTGSPVVNQNAGGAQQMCRTKWTVSAPGISCSISSNSEEDGTHKFTIEAEKLSISSTACTTAQQLRVEVQSFCLRDDVRSSVPLDTLRDSDDVLYSNRVIE